MTYYKYVKRDATSQVNWADVSKKFSDEIARIGTERDKKRAEIDKATDELVTKINEAPMGQHKNANLFTSQLVDQATQDTLRMNKLLKSGEIRPSEYMNYIENQKSSVTGIYDMVKGYQDVYTDKMTRMQNGESLSPESDGMAVVEGFGNFANITPVMDMYGNVTMYNNSTGETMSAAQMNAITKQYFNAYDLDGDLTGKAEQLGEYTKSIMDGGVKTREDVTASPAYQKVKGDLIDATLEGNLSVTTVLDRKLPGYSTSYSPKTAGANDILMIDDPRQPGSGAQIPLVEVVEQVSRMTDDQKREIFPEGVDVDGLIKIAEDQRKAARKWVEADLTSRFNMIETPQAEFAASTKPPTKTEIEYGQLQNRVATTLDNWMALQYAKTAAEKEKAEEAIVGQFYQGKEVVGADVTSGDVVLTLKDGESITIESTSADGTPFNAIQWAEQGNFLYEDPAIARSLIRQTQAGETPYGAMTDVRAGRPAFIQQTIPNFLEKKVTTADGEEKKVSEVVAALPTVGAAGNIDEANKAVTELKSMFSDLKILDADIRAHDEEVVVNAGQQSSDYADYPAISIYLPRQMEVPVILPAYQKAYDSFFNALASAMERGVQLTEGEIMGFMYEGAKGYNSSEIRKALGLAEGARRTSSGAGVAGSAKSLYGG